MDSNLPATTLLATTAPPEPPPEPELSIGHRERMGPHPALAAVLAVVVGAAVFGLLLRIRRAFGMK